jgi:hypothetical protein
MALNNINMNEKITSRVQIKLAMFGCALIAHAVYIALATLDILTLRLLVGYCIILFLTGLSAVVLSLRK